MLSILEKLTARRSERAKANAASWSQFVADVVDERTTDADEILTALERLNRTPEELQTACELLNQRREWARQAADGAAAESTYSKLTEQATAAEKELESLIELHQKKQIPLQNKIEAARNAISTAADARRRLLETTGNEAKRAAFDCIDSELAEVQSEHQTVLKTLQDRERWVLEVESRGNTAATEDSQRLADAKSGLSGMKKRDAELRGKLTALLDRRNAAAESLLKPEAI